MEKLTEHELLKRLDNEFYDVDFQVVTSATKGVVATVQFYEDKIEEDEDEWIYIYNKAYCFNWSR